MKYVTDYPIEGNPEGKWVEVKLLSYDRNKYVYVDFNGMHDEVKQDYIKSIDTKGDKKDLKHTSLCFLPTEIGGKKPTRREIFAELKEERKYCISYFVYSSSKDSYKSVIVKSLDEAMRHAANFLRQNPTATVAVNRKVKTKWYYTSLEYLYITPDSLTSARPIGQSRDILASRKRYDAVAKLRNSIK